ncbi:hypothetical protein [Sulfuriflexus mobilis]|uniref:hypothetical protein n=1 Tax=Sulfuriflexus mobilis TaxID=1811807 RepID=UPI000F83AC9C|nr:hypothetical protein [Sulfuriflexus mobilis]
MHPKNEQCADALGYWTIGIQYLHLTESVIEETISQGNIWMNVTDYTPSFDDYLNKTKWSDHNLIIPLLFDFYHGLEVLLKGFLVAEDIKIKTNHKLSDLHSSFETYYSNNKLSQYIEKYITQNKLPVLLNEFCEECGMSMDEYYQALKYPESTKGKPYRHTPLKYKGEQGVPFFKDMLNDIRSLRKEAVSLGRTICENV